MQRAGRDFLAGQREIRSRSREDAITPYKYEGRHNKNKIKQKPGGSRQGYAGAEGKTTRTHKANIPRPGPTRQRPNTPNHHPLRLSSTGESALASSPSPLAVVLPPPLPPRRGPSIRRQERRIRSSVVWESRGPILRVMKFGKDFRNHLEETLPAWRDKYLAYKALKKLIKNLVPREPAAAPPLPPPAPAAADAEGPGAPAAAHGNVNLANWFASILDAELHKLNEFYIEREEWYVIRLQVRAKSCHRS